MIGYYNYLRAEDEFKFGNYRNAIKKYNKAILSGDLKETETCNAYYGEGNCFINLGDYDEAIKAFNLALQWDKNQYLVYHKLGITYYNKSDYEQSIQYFEKAIELEPNDFEPWKFKGLALEKLERYNGAETALKNALKCPSLSDSAIIDSINNKLFIIRLRKSSKKATELQENGKYADAIKVYDSIMENIDSNSVAESSDEIDQIHADSILNNGICLKALKKYDSAIGILNKAINLFPDKTNAYIELANCYIQLKKFDEALVYYEKLEDITDDENEKIEINILKKVTVFQKLLLKKDYLAALNEVNSIPERNDESILLKKVFSGICYFYLERYDEALDCMLPYVDAEWIDSATEDNSIRGMVYTYVGGVYYMQKNYETALKYLNKCVQIDFNGLADTGSFMGECYIALGEYEKGLEALRKAVEAWDDIAYYDIPYIESRIQFAKEKLAEVKAKVPPSHIIINGNNNPINLGGILATDDAVINRSVIGKDSAQEENDVCFCPYCGTKINADFLFCPKCGRKLNED